MAESHSTSRVAVGHAKCEPCDARTPEGRVKRRGSSDCVGWPDSFTSSRSTNGYSRASSIVCPQNCCCAPDPRSFASRYGEPAGEAAGDAAGVPKLKFTAGALSAPGCAAKNGRGAKPNIPAIKFVGKLRTVVL